jgi:HEPN domain-containing protein
MASTRYPNSVPEGAPFESYDADQSGRAIAAAERILAWCERHLA